MMKTKFTLRTVLFSTILTLGTGALVFADGDDDDEYGPSRGWRGGGSRPGVAEVRNPQYREECGACHFAYQPGLLPARSWRRVMAGLEHHFGESAELPTEDVRALEAYLVTNAADRSSHKRSRKIMRYLRSNEAPLRVSDTPYFIKEHRELPPRMVEKNPKVGSFSNCPACHTTADRGSYSERHIRIPGYGRWEDD